jgi:hypothetical protein
MQQSVEAMRSIPARMNEAWNRGDATAFFSDFAGEKEPPPSRYSMQLFVMGWQNERWEVVALQNSRLISVEAILTLEAISNGGPRSP